VTVRYLLDTNICIYIQRARPPSVLAKFEALSGGDAAISAVTWGDLVYGAEMSTRRQSVLDALQEFISFVPVLSVPVDAGACYGMIRARLERSGEIIGNNDLWIAAHALAAGLTLVTNNEREFSRVPELTIENWVR
jgi:tRNA(fMet)-specific endonuclease VapC